MKYCKIYNQNETIEIPYYKLEETCKCLTEKYLNSKDISEKEQLQRKKNFLEFATDYKTFTPYFDFVFYKLKYTLENPFLISNTYMSYNEKDDAIYYYAIPKENASFKKYELQEISKPLFIVKKEKNIKRVLLDEEFSNIRECFLNEKGEMVYLECSEELHNFWAKLWIHDLISQDKRYCKQYIRLLKDEGLLVYDQAELFILYKHWIQVSQIFVSGKKGYYCRYHSDLLNETQAKFLQDLKNKELLPKEFDLDLKQEELEKHL